MSTPLEKLGRLLVGQGLLTSRQLEECLREGRETGRTLSDILVSRGLLTSEALTEALGRTPRPSDIALSGPSMPPSADPAEVVDARRDPRRCLAQYVLVRELGRGGMGVVFKAWDEQLKRWVALKVIRSRDLGLDGASRDAEVKELLREARTAIRLQHPNIVRVYELGHHEDRHFLAMEYVEGKTLAELLRPDRTHSRGAAFHAAPKRFLVLLREVAAALDYAHRQDPPVVHRDVKPHNILVDGKARACLVDFGLAKELGRGDTLTMSGIVKGTPAYMAPEQASGGKIDGRTDVYALGAVLYEFLTGEPPFSGATARDILNKIVSEDPVPPSDVLKARNSRFKAPPDLERICLKALEKDPARRYRSAQAFSEEIDRFFEGAPVRAKAPGQATRAVRWAARRKAVLASLAAAAVMAAVAAVALLSRQPPPEKIVERVVVESDADARIRAATERVDALAADMRYKNARTAYQELLVATRDASEKRVLQGRLEDLRLEALLLDGLIARVRKVPRDLAVVELRDGLLPAVRVLDATADALVVRAADRVVEVPWNRMTPLQYARLADEFWPGIDGDAALGLVLWCVRHRLKAPATYAARPLWGTPREERVRRLFEEAGWVPPVPEQKVTPQAAPPAVVVRPADPPAPLPPPPPPSPPVARPDPLKALVDGWTWRPVWKFHGPELGHALAERGWADWAVEIFANQLKAPSRTPEEEAAAELALAHLRSAEGTEEAIELAIRSYEAWIAGNPSRPETIRARAQSAGLRMRLAERRADSGRLPDARDAFVAAEKGWRELAERLRRDGAAEDALRAERERALALVRHSEMLARVTAQEIDAVDLARRAAEAADVLIWAGRANLLNAEGCVLRGRALAVIAGCSRPSRMARPQWEATLEAFTTAKSTALPLVASSSDARGVFMRAVVAESAALRAWSAAVGDLRFLDQALEVVEEAVKIAPELRTEPVLRLEQLRVHTARGDKARAQSLLESLQSDSRPAVRQAAVDGRGLPEPAFEGPIATPAPPLPAAFANRGPQKQALLKAGGGGTDTEEAVLAALSWLSRHQAPDGSWRLMRFVDQCRKVPTYAGSKSCPLNPGAPGGRTVPMQVQILRPGEIPRLSAPAFGLGPWEADDAAHEAGVTGLAVLAFLGAGHTIHSTDTHDGLVFGDVLARGLRWMVRNQDPEGCIGTRASPAYMYGHAICAAALAEAYGMTGSLALRRPAQRAIDFLIAAQNPGKAWRYSWRCGDNDSSVTGWAVQALRAAQAAGLSFPAAAFEGYRAWFDEVTEFEYGRAGYTHKGTGKVLIAGANEHFDHHESPTAIGVQARLLLDRNRGDIAVSRGADLLLRDKPVWNGNAIDFHYWHQATNALFLFDGLAGAKWKAWNADLKSALLQNQNTSPSGCKHGSWEPIDRWSGEGGRVYATALNALTLQTYYRWPVPPMKK